MSERIGNGLMGHLHKDMGYYCTYLFFFTIFLSLFSIMSMGILPLLVGFFFTILASTMFGLIGGVIFVLGIYLPVIGVTAGLAAELGTSSSYTMAMVGMSSSLVMAIIIGIFVFMTTPFSGRKNVFIGSWIGYSVGGIMKYIQLHELLELTSDQFYLIFALDFSQVFLAMILAPFFRDMLVSRTFKGLREEIESASYEKHVQTADQRRLHEATVMDKLLEGIAGSVSETPMDALDQKTTDYVLVTSGIDTSGENLKITVKVVNKSDLALTNVTVTLDAPEGLEYTKNSSASLRLGSIGPEGSFQNGIFWLRSTRCVDDTYGGTVVFRDARDEVHLVEIPRKRLVNICPMLESTDSIEEVFNECKYGGYHRNSMSVKFTSDPNLVFVTAKKRISNLDFVDSIEDYQERDMYLGYVCVVGKTKYGDSKFAAEIQVSGIPTGGVLTISVYSNDASILSGFFVDIMTDMRQQIEIIEETTNMNPTVCSNCNAPLDLYKLDESNTYSCQSCGFRGKLPPWMK